MEIFGLFNFNERKLFYKKIFKCFINSNKVSGKVYLISLPKSLGFIGWVCYYLIIDLRNKFWKSLEENNTISFDLI